jgi:hypothetical protein
MTSFSFKRTVGDVISRYVSPTLLGLSVYSAFSALLIGALKWLGGCSGALRTVGLVQGGSWLLICSGGVRLILILPIRIAWYMTVRNYSVLKGV